jgi:hypothetical protein
MQRKSSYEKGPRPETVAAELPPGLRVTLAAFADSPSGVAEIAVASMGLGSRVLLEQAGLIESAGTLKEPLDPKITRFGRRVFSACAILVDRDRRARVKEHIAKVGDGRSGPPSVPSSASGDRELITAPATQDVSEAVLIELAVSDRTHAHLLQAVAEGLGRSFRLAALAKPAAHAQVISLLDDALAFVRSAGLAEPAEQDLWRLTQSGQQVVGHGSQSLPDATGSDRRSP